MAMTNRELIDVVASTVTAPLLGLGGVLAWSGLWAVGIPLMLATAGAAIWYSRRKAHRDEDEAIARAAAYDAEERGQDGELRQ